jgi:hypothetical protein
MTCRGEIPFVTRDQILDEAANELTDVLADAARTIADPDYWGGEWYELYQGNPLLPLYVMVDILGNVVHVRRAATTFEDERFTVTYLPSWFHAALRSATAPHVLRIGAGSESISAQVADRDRAVPIRIEVSITHPIDTRLAVQGLTSGLRLPQVVYDLQPSRGSLALRAGVDPATAAETVGDANPQGRIEHMHWTAPSIRITAAPGVTVTPRPLYPVFDTEFDPWELTDLALDASGLAATPMWGWFVMNAAQCQHDGLGWRSHWALSTSTQALHVQIERRQNAEALPTVGDPRRITGTSEVDLLTDRPGSGRRFEEATRPDGVDLLFLTNGAAFELARSRSDPVQALRSELLHAGDLVFTAGGISPFTPIPVAIRVDPQSPDDRFAYTISYLNAGKPVSAPWLASREGPFASGGPFFRLTVIRTDAVRVNADLLFSPLGAEDLADVLEYRELVVPSLDEVPVAILDHGDAIPVAALPCRPLTLEEISELIITGIGLLPWPPAQVIADLEDYATIISYLTLGTDPFGEEMGRVEFAVTLAGVLLPEVLERILKRVSRLIVVGDEPAVRIAKALEAAVPANVIAAGSPLAEAVVVP